MTTNIKPEYRPQPGMAPCRMPEGRIVLGAMRRAWQKD